MLTCLQQHWSKVKPTSCKIFEDNWYLSSDISRVEKQKRKRGIVLDSSESDLSGFIESECANTCFSKQIRVGFSIELNFAVLLTKMGWKL